MVLSADALWERIEKYNRDDILSHKIEYEELTVTLSPKAVLSFLTFLKEEKDLRFIQIIDICGVDYPSRENRFDVVYHLISFHENARIRLKLSIAEEETVPSAKHIFPVADWLEREIFDMYGIVFEGHDDMRRILTDYGFSGYPLRKDFPVTGFVELRYDEEKKRVAYDKVNLTQDFRSFDFLSPWEGSEKIAAQMKALDEKGKGI